jgi:hypothetical protein
MSRFLLAALAGVLTLACSAPAQAGHGYRHSGGIAHRSVYRSGTFRSGSVYRGPVRIHPYVLKYGTKFSHGYWFGRNNFHWTSRYWSGRYGRHLYWSPYARAWYFWHRSHRRYYPLSYLGAAGAAGGGAVGDSAAGGLPPSGDFDGQGSCGPESDVADALPPSADLDSPPAP